MNIREKSRNVRVNKMRVGVLISVRGGEGKKKGERKALGWKLEKRVRDKFARSGEALYLETDDEIFPYVKIKRDGWPTLRIATSKWIFYFTTFFAKISRTGDLRCSPAGTRFLVRRKNNRRNRNWAGIRGKWVSFYHRGCKGCRGI